MKTKIFILALLSFCLANESQSQCGPGEDTTPPVISVPAHTEVDGCEYFDGMNFTITDDCTDGPLITLGVDTISTIYANAIQPDFGTNPCTYLHDWSFLMLGVQQGYFENIDTKVRFIGESEIIIQCSFHYFGQPNAILTGNVILNNKLNWTEWQALNRGYKADCGAMSTAANHVDWTYWDVSPESHLSGSGELEGTELDIYWAPTVHYYGVQLGLGANNTSPNYGLGGWLQISGHYANSLTQENLDLNISGDIALELQEECYSPLVRYAYTATDAAGNTSTAVQLVEYHDNNAPTLAFPAPTTSSVCTGFTPWQATWQDCSPLQVEEYSEVVLDSYMYTSQATDGCGHSNSITIVQTIEPEDCSVVGGCTDPASCEYDPAATLDDGSCLYGTQCVGCMDPLAVNYDATALYSDGSCSYAMPLAFFDRNGDGLKQETENGIANATLFANDTYYTSDRDGFFHITDGQGNSYTLIAHSDELSTNASIQSWGENGAPTFGLQFSADALPTFNFLPNTSFTNAHCTLGLQDALIIENRTNEIATVYASLGNNHLLQLVDAEWTELANLSSSQNEMLWPAFDLLPGQTKTLAAAYNAPISYSEVTMGALVYFYDADQNEITNLYLINDKPVSCDPVSVEIVLSAETFEEQNFVLAGSPVAISIPLFNSSNTAIDEYSTLVSFENSPFDLSSLQVINSTRNINCALNPDGTLHISVNGTMEANGLGAVYMIGVLQSTLQHGDLIVPTQTHYSGNSPLIENGGTILTIFNCSTLSGIEGPAEVCLNDAITLTGEQNFVYDYAWFIDNEMVGNEPSFEFNGTETGMQSLQLVMSNPLCTVTHETNVNTNPIPDNTLTAPTDGIVTAPAGSSWEWFVEGNPNVVISDEQSWDVSMLNTNIYVVTTNEFGCSSTSNSVATVGIGENTIAFQLYPNPTEGMLTIQSTEVMESIVLFDALGKKVESYNPKGSVFTLDSTPFANGLYTAQILTSSGTHSAVISVK